MKFATTAKLPKKTSAKVNDPDNSDGEENSRSACVYREVAADP